MGELRQMIKEKLADMDSAPTLTAIKRVLRDVLDLLIEEAQERETEQVRLMGEQARLKDEQWRLHRKIARAEKEGGFK